MTLQDGNSRRRVELGREKKSAQIYKYIWKHTYTLLCNMKIINAYHEWHMQSFFFFFATNDVVCVSFICVCAWWVRRHVFFSVVLYNICVWQLSFVHILWHGCTFFFRKKNKPICMLMCICSTLIHMYAHTLHINFLFLWLNTYIDGNEFYIWMYDYVHALEKKMVYICTCKRVLRALFFYLFFFGILCSGDCVWTTFSCTIGDLKFLFWGGFLKCVRMTT